MFARTHIGHGVGLRHPHYRDVLERGAGGADWFEVTPENFFGAGGRPWKVLERVRREAPVVLHGVSLGIANADPPNTAYLDALSRVIDRIEPAWVSDHLCWSAHRGHYVHDLWPVPHTEETLAHVASHVDAVQTRLRRAILLENVSRYVLFTDSTLEEPAFLNELCRRTGCGVLLDVNNVFVTAHNLRFDADAYVDAIDPAVVGQIHLAGHTDEGDFLVDTHAAAVSGDVWRLHRRALDRVGPVPTLVEWDDALPAYEVLVGEARRAASMEKEIFGAA